MIFYRIKNHSLFEKNRTRELKAPKWVAVPNKQDGDGYTELLDHPNGGLHYGVWIAVLLVASKSKNRWSLVRDNGEPHSPSSLARMTHFPSSAIEEAISRLVEVGWLEAVSQSGEEVTEIPQEGAGKVRESRTNPAGRCGNPAPIPQASATIQNNTRQDITGQNSTEQRTPLPPSQGEPVKLVSVEIPASLETPEFRKAFDEWIEFKREKGQGYKPKGIKKLLSRLAAWGPVRSIQSIEHSMASNYSGLFEPRAGPGQGGSDLFGGLRDFVQSGGSS